MKYLHHRYSFRFYKKVALAMKQVKKHQAMLAEDCSSARQRIYSEDSTTGTGKLARTASHPAYQIKDFPDFMGIGTGKPSPKLARAKGYMKSHMETVSPIDDILEEYKDAIKNVSTNYFLQGGNPASQFKDRRPEMNAFMSRLVKILAEPSLKLLMRLLKVQLGEESEEYLALLEKKQKFNKVCTQLCKIVATTDDVSDVIRQQKVSDVFNALCQYKTGKSAPRNWKESDDPVVQALTTLYDTIQSTWQSAMKKLQEDLFPAAYASHESDLVYKFQQFLNSNSSALNYNLTTLSKEDADSVSNPPTILWLQSVTQMFVREIFNTQEYQVHIPAAVKTTILMQQTQFTKIYESLNKIFNRINQLATINREIDDADLSNTIFRKASEAVRQHLTTNSITFSAFIFKTVEALQQSGDERFADSFYLEPLSSTGKQPQSLEELFLLLRQKNTDIVKFYYGLYVSFNSEKETSGGSSWSDLPNNFHKFKKWLQSKCDEAKKDGALKVKLNGKLRRFNSVVAEAELSKGMLITLIKTIIEKTGVVEKKYERLNNKIQDLLQKLQEVEIAFAQQGIIKEFVLSESGTVSMLRIPLSDETNCLIKNPFTQSTQQSIHELLALYLGSSLTDQMAY